ncbi:cytochrome P450 [Gordonia sp. CPCC 206044]|uniref:cytochrome P450 n=1 Tax=Gordonia sp. CPCC 206044 TaxID=3140793 RepID=UPI003AF402D3
MTIATTTATSSLNPLVTDIPLLDTPAPYRREWIGEDGLTRIELPSGHEAVSLTNYEHVKTLMLDRTASRTLCNVDGGPSFMPTNWAPEVLINLDAPVHGVVREFVSHEFSARAMNDLVPMISELTSAALDSLEQSSAPDLVAQVFRVVPGQVVCRLLGVSVTYAGWMNELGRRIQLAPRDNIELIERSWVELYGWVQRLVSGEEPADEDGLIAIYRQRATRPEFAAVDDALIAGTVMGIVLGGDNNVATMLTKTAYAALAAPALYAGMTAGTVAVADLVEEILRLMPLGTPGSFPRELTRPLVVEGIELAAGSIVYPHINAANRDPDVFPDPLRIDPDRPGHKHLQYGYGMHRCMGSALSQIELITVLQCVVARFPELRLAVEPEQLEWDLGIGLRRPRALPVDLGCRDLNASEVGEHGVR